jgi:hypothetical protein
MRRGTAPTAALVLLAAGVGFLFGRLGRDPSGATEPLLARRADGVGPAPLPALAEADPPRATRALDLVERMSAEAERAEPAEAEAPAPTSPFPSIEVRCEGAEEVYALPAGARGTDRIENVSTAIHPNQGVFTLRVPRAGSYDVGARTAHGVSVLATDVPIPGASIRLVPPALERIDVEVEDALRRRLRRLSPEPIAAVVELVPLGEGPVRTYPGRSERGKAAPHQIDALASETARLAAPAGRPYRVLASLARRGSATPLLANPDIMTPPATVRISVATLLRVAPRFHPPDRATSGMGGVSVELSVDGVDPTRHAWVAAPGVPLSSLAGDVAMTVPSAAGTLSWRGEHVRAGSAVFEADEDGEARLEPPIEVLSFPEATSGRTEEVTLARIDAEGRLPPSLRPRSIVRAKEGSPSFGWSLDWDDGRGEGTISTASPELLETLVVHAGAFWVTETAVRPREGSTLRLRRAGHVQVVPEAPLPEGLTLSVRRRDGGLLLASGAGEFLRAHAGVQGARPDVRVLDPDDSLEASLFLGPLVPGDVALVYSVGGVDVSADVVRVEPGRIAVSRVRFDSTGK